MINRNHPFVSGAKYRHCNCLDLDVYIQRVRYAGPNYVLANVIYLNRNWEGGNFIIDQEKNVKFKKEHWKFWKRIG